MTDSITHLRDLDGFANIGDYGVIGNGRGVALVAADGAVDWWAVPRLDSSPAFAAVLDPQRGGHVLLRPVDEDAEMERRYLPHTNLLQTTFTTSSGSVRMTDSLNSGNAGALPWSELARRVEGLSGSVTMKLAVVPGNGLGRWEPWARLDGHGPLLHAGQVTLGVTCSEGIELKTGHARVDAQFEVAEGETALVAVVASQDEPLFFPSVATVASRMDMTAANWRQWCSQVTWRGERREQVVRSALALKLLMMADTGATAAAATTSLPESVGGPKNWDYRFCWVRDSSMMIDAMLTCGLQEEVHAAMAWLLRTMRADGPGIHVMYTLEGELPTSSEHAPVPGYRHSTPVMIGNGASSQLQLGIYGDLFGAVERWVKAGHALDVNTGRQLSDLADACADRWRRADSGLWELGQDEQYTSSKMNCWRALDTAARLAEQGHFGGRPGRWKQEAEIVRAWVGDHCWSERKQAYTFFAGTDDLDASVLLGARFGFDRGERMASTIKAVQEELSTGPLVYRYSGVHREEQTFIACAYWLVEALARTGQLKQARAQMSSLDRMHGPLGLLSEMCTPGTFDLVGNIPQALSHLSLINAAEAIREEEGEAQGN